MEGNILSNEDFEKSLQDLNVKIIGENEIEKIKPAVGEGNFGKVYKGIYCGKYIAIKKMMIDFESIDDIMDLNNEIKSMMIIEQDNIPKFYGIWKKKGHLHLICDFIDGKNLRNIYPLIDKKTKLEILRDLCDIFSYLHSRKLIHRDIKPDNVMVLSNNKPILVDFGTAKIARHTTTYTGNQKGTTCYMPPEIFGLDPDEDTEKQLALTSASDIWATGCMMSEMFSNILPWHTKVGQKRKNDLTIQADMMQKKKFPIPSTLDDDIKEIVVKILDYDVVNRPSAIELKKMLETCIAKLNN